MTADSVSQLLNIPIHTCPELREIVSNEKSIQEFKGLSLEELKRLFPKIAEDAELPYPWWKTKFEDLEAVKMRVRALLEDLIEKQEDVPPVWSRGKCCCCFLLSFGDGKKAYGVYNKMV